MNPPPTEKEPVMDHFNLSELRHVAGVPDDAEDNFLLPLLDIFNTALEYGLSRADVIAALGEVEDCGNVEHFVRALTARVEALDAAEGYEEGD